VVENDRASFNNFRKIKQSVSTGFYSVKDKLGQFSYSELSAVKIFMCLFVLIISCLVMVTQSLNNPLSTLPVLSTILTSIFFVFLGHYYSIEFSQDRRLKIFIFYLPIFTSLILMIYTAGSIQIADGNSKSFFGYFVAIQISVLAGACSGEMSNAKWLGNALFIRHINGVLKSQGISYLYWDSEGDISIIDPDEINPKWNPSNDDISFRLEGKTIPFSFITPVHVNGKKVTSALSEVMSLFEGLTVTWKEALSVYKKSVIDGEKRLSWINFIQVTVIQNPHSISMHNSKVPTKSQRINVDSSSMIISWKHPDYEWVKTVESILKTNVENSPLHSALISNESLNSILPKEREVFKSKTLQDDELNVRVISLRSYLNLFILLFQEMSSKSLSRSELSKHCIKSLSSWFTTIQSDSTLFEFSKMKNFSDMNSLSQFITYGLWEQKFSDAIIDPISMFMSLNDELLNRIDGSNLPDELSAAIQSMVVAIQRDVIVSNNHAPVTNHDSQSIRFGKRRELGLNRKGIIISGICKMYFISCLLSVSGGGNQ
jgi:hypothetical protein